MKTKEVESEDYLRILPQQLTGKEIKAEKQVSIKDINEAKYFYLDAKKRLLDVNRWHELAGAISAEFKVCDQTGNFSDKQLVAKGDLIRIDVPGPGSKAGDGYDWVYVEEMKERSGKEIDSIGFRVRPWHAPGKEDGPIAHFYEEGASSSFILSRKGTDVKAEIVDRNIKPNDETDSLIDKVRQVSVAIGAMGAFSKLQWEKLAEAIVAQAPKS